MEDIACESDRRTLYVYTIGSKKTNLALARHWDRSSGGVKDWRYLYDDLVKGWEPMHDNFDFTDTDNGVAAGASYGGFMINWIQGDPLSRSSRRWSAMTGHSLRTRKNSTEALWFIEHNFNGTFWANRDNYRRWDPSAPEHILQFDTPQLIIHSSKDHRLPISEGLCLFNVL